MLRISNGDAIVPRWLRGMTALSAAVLLHAVAPACWAAVTPAKPPMQVKVDPTALANVVLKAEKGDPEAQAALGLLLSAGYGMPQDDAKATEWLARAAAQGNAVAQDRLGVAYATGRGVPHNDGLAVEWFLKAAAQKNADALGNLADMYDAGRGVPKDEKRALDLNHQAAEEGDIRAQIYLGHLYSKGQGVQRDDKLALAWFRKGAVQGSDDGQLMVGYMTENGRGVAGDDRVAAEWYRKAAAQGNFFAEYNLGQAYLHGKSISRDYKLAAEWMRKAAEKGYAPAQIKLGYLYRNAMGLPQDDLLASEWYRMAAMQGDISAMTTMASFYDMGIGVKANKETAAEWRRKAVEHKMADLKNGKNTPGGNDPRISEVNLYLLNEGKRTAHAQGGDIVRAAMVAKKSDGTLEAELVLTDDPKKLRKDWESPEENLQLTTADSIRLGNSIHGFAIFSGCTRDAENKCTVAVSYQVYFPNGSLHSMSATGFPLNHVVVEPGSTLSFDIPVKVELTQPTGAYVIQARVRDLNTDSTLELQRAFLVSK